MSPNPSGGDINTAMTAVRGWQLSFSECAYWNAILPSILISIAHFALNRANTVFTVSVCLSVFLSETFLVTEYKS